MGKQELALTKQELSNVLEYTHDIIDNLPDVALQELMGGNDNDISGLLEDVMVCVNDILYKNIFDVGQYGIQAFEKSLDDSMKKLSYNYFKTTMLPNFIQGWRNLEWGNIIQLYPWCVILASRSHGKSFETCYSFPLWRMWRYDKPNFLQKNTIDNKNSKETFIITNESKLGRRHLKLINEEIRSNDLLADKLLPDSLQQLGTDKILAKNGSSVEYRTYGSSGIRGNHVGATVVDDFLDESCLYSIEQREKFQEIFDASIKPIIEPQGHLVVSGTPFHANDVYQKCKEDSKFKVFEYPAIFPDGTLLAPERGYDFKELMEIKKSVGTLKFSREYLVSPVTDSSTIFPWEYLRTSTIGMEQIDYCENIESFPFKLKRVVIGCDFARSANIGADYTAFTVWGKDFQDRYYLLHVWRKKGASYDEQVNMIVRLNKVFRANKIRAEDNGMQGMFIDMVKKRGVTNIEPFTTTAHIKKNSTDGLPSLSVLFERGEIKIPYKDGKTRDMTDTVFNEFNSITFLEDKKKLESSAGHDDIVMSSFFAITDLRENKTGFKVHYI